MEEITNSQYWHEYPIKAQPHHTDYAGTVWHGTYLTWMEEARVEYLRAGGLEYADLVKIGCSLLVVDLSVRYHKAMQMGQKAIVKTRISPSEKVRIVWDYQIESPDASKLYVSGKVTLVAVDTDKNKIMRKISPKLESALYQHPRANSLN